MINISNADRNAFKTWYWSFLLNFCVDLEMALTLNLIGIHL